MEHIYVADQKYHLPLPHQKKAMQECGTSRPL